MKSEFKIKTNTLNKLQIHKKNLNIVMLLFCFSHLYSTVLYNTQVAKSTSQYQN